MFTPDQEFELIKRVVGARSHAGAALAVSWLQSLEAVETALLALPTSTVPPLLAVPLAKSLIDRHLELGGSREDLLQRLQTLGQSLS